MFSGSTMGFVIGIVLVVGIGGYLYYAYTSHKWPF